MTARGTGGRQTRPSRAKAAASLPLVARFFIGYTYEFRTCLLTPKICELYANSMYFTDPIILTRTACTVIPGSQPRVLTRPAVRTSGVRTTQRDSISRRPARSESSKYSNSIYCGHPCRLQIICRVYRSISPALTLQQAKLQSAWQVYPTVSSRVKCFIRHSHRNGLCHGSSASTERFHTEVS